MPGGSQSFPRAARLRKRAQFLRMNRESSRISTPHFIILWNRGTGPCARLGVTVTRRVAGSVGRNRIKRMVREAFRRCGPLRSTPVDVVVIARQGAQRLGGPQIQAQIQKGLARIPSEPGA